MDKAFRVYVSTPVDENLSPVQQQFKKVIFAELNKAGVLRVGFSEPDEVSKFTIEGARELMRSCQGVLVLSFSQVTATHLVRQGESYTAPTEYNHLEGGMAVAQSKPLFVIRNSDVAFRGINLGGHGYQVSIPQSAKPKAWVKSQTFRKAFDSWLKDVKKHRHVFLGYSGAAQGTANAIHLYIKDLGLDVLDWRKFTAGESILQRIEEAARMCYCGIFIFTKDDALAAEDKKTAGKKTAGKKTPPAAKAVAVPRDNVVFEAGYFVSTRGKKRTLIVLEDGAKFPVDLGGDIYLQLKDRNDTSTIETGLNNYLNSMFGSG